MLHFLTEDQRGWRSIATPGVGEDLEVVSSPLSSSMRMETSILIGVCAALVVAAAVLIMVIVRLKKKLNPAPPASTYLEDKAQAVPEPIPYDHDDLSTVSGTYDRYQRSLGVSGGLKRCSSRVSTSTDQADIISVSVLQPCSLVKSAVLWDTELCVLRDTMYYTCFVFISGYPYRPIGHVCGI